MAALECLPQTSVLPPPPIRSAIDVLLVSTMALVWTVTNSRAYSKRVRRTNCALRIKKCAPLISSGIYFLSTS